MTMDGGGGDPRIWSSGLRSWPDSRGGVWSAMSPSFTPLKRYSCNKDTTINENVQSIPQRFMLSSSQVFQPVIRLFLIITFTQNVSGCGFTLLAYHICTSSHSIGSRSQRIIRYTGFILVSFINSLSLSDLPSVSIEGYDYNWYVGRPDATLLCQANANPAPTTVTWTS